MKINITSDIHLGFPMTSLDNYEDLINLEPADVLVIAGDVLEGAGRDNITWDRKFVQQFNRFDHVLFVPGNHDYWDGEYFERQVELYNYCNSIGVTMLQKEAIDIDGTRFAGATLWTDFNKADPRAIFMANDCMGDFCGRILYNDAYNGIVHFRAQHAYNVHKQHREFLDNACADVIITHHSPSTLSQDPEFRGNQLDYAYHCTDVDHLMESTKLWVHGHTHQRLDYEHPYGCRIICNARGYLYYESMASAKYTGKIVEL